MILLATALAMTAADLDALDSAVQRCDREAVNPIFAGVAASRSLFTTETYREQEAIVAERLDISNRKRALREASGAAMKGGDTMAKLDLQSLALEDRQRALNDRRMLEGLRGEAIDAKRRYYLAHCANGKK